MLNRAVTGDVVVAEALSRVMRMNEAVGRPKVMHGDETGQQQEKNTDIPGTRDGAEVGDFQRKPHGEEFVPGHDHQDPDVRVAEDVDQEVEDLTGNGVGDDEGGKIDEILGDQDQWIENTEGKHEEGGRCSTHVTTAQGSKRKKVIDQGDGENNQR